MLATTWNILFAEPLVLIVAVTVALTVVAILMIPCRFVLKYRRTWFFTTIGSGLVAVLAAINGMLVVTRFGLLYDGHQMLPLAQVPFSKWLQFMGINAILSAGAVILCSCAAMAITLLSRPTSNDKPSP